jgi:hypothetical protein
LDQGFFIFTRLACCDAMAELGTTLTTVVVDNVMVVLANAMTVVGSFIEEHMMEEL